MNLVRPGRYAYGSTVLILTAGICAGIVLISDRRDITSASVMVSAVLLFLVGILILIFNKPDSPDERFVSLLQVQGTINLCTIAAELGLSGQSCMVPKERTGYQDVMHLIPTSRYPGSRIEGETFVSGEGFSGILNPPVSTPLLHELKRRYQLSIPDTRDELSILIREIGTDVMDLADTVTVTWSDTGVIIRMHGYRLINGCRRITTESPACCMMQPCVTCSLFASLLAEGLAEPVQVERCMPGLKKDDVEMIFSLLP